MTGLFFKKNYELQKEGNKEIDLFKIMTVMLMIVIQCGRKLLRTPGAKNADQSVLITS